MEGYGFLFDNNPSPTPSCGKEKLKGKKPIKVGRNKLY